MTLREYMYAVESRPSYWNLTKVEIHVFSDARCRNRDFMSFSPWNIPETSYLWNVDVAFDYVSQYSPKTLCICINDFDDPWYPHGWGHEHPRMIEFI